MDDVAVDAKRILLRYGAPIDVLDDVGEVERIELARFIARTLLPDREKQLRQELADRGYMEPPAVKTRKSRAKAAQKPAAKGTPASPPPDKVTVKPKAKDKPKPKAKGKPKPKVAAKAARKSAGKGKASAK